MTKSSKSPAPSVEAQLVVRFDGLNFKLEIPQGGGRRVIPLDPRKPSSWGQAIQEELQASHFWLRDQKQREQELKLQAQERIDEAKVRWDLALHRKVFDTSARRPNQGKDFATRIFGPRQHPEAIRGGKSILQVLKQGDRQP